MPLSLDGQTVVQTTTVDLPSFIASKRHELDMLTQQMSLCKSRQDAILAELQSLVPPTP